MEKEGMFWFFDKDKVKCRLCLRKCRIENGKEGYCKVRFIKRNKLYTKNFFLLKHRKEIIENIGIFHFYPNSDCLVIESVGNNFPICLTCEKVNEKKLKEIEAEKIIGIAKRNKVKSIVYSSEEPFMFIETVYKIAKLAYREGIKNVLVTNGFVATDVIKNISKYFNAVLIVVINSLEEEFYQKHFQVIDINELKASIKYFKKQRFFIEIKNVFVHPFQNTLEKQKEFTEWIIENLGSEIPYHISTIKNPIDQFFPLTENELKEIYNDAVYSGLRYIYLDNFVGYENTFCYNCRELVIERMNMNVVNINLINGRCPRCHTKIDVIE